MSLLSTDKGKRVGTDANLQENVSIWTEESQHAAVFRLGATQMQQQTKLITKPENEMREKGLEWHVYIGFKTLYHTVYEMKKQSFIT